MRLQHSLRRQRGQSMVEFAIVLPLLLVLLLAVGYFGHTIISLQNLNAGARAAAREMAFESTQTPGQRVEGNYAASAERFLSAARSYLNQSVRPEQLKARESTRLSGDYNTLLNLQGRFEKHTEHRFSYSLRETIDATRSQYNDPPPRDRKTQPPANLTQLQVGLGVMFYGGTLEYSLDELVPLSRFIFRNQKDPAIRMGATALMPAELPLRGPGGLFSVNPWLPDLLGSNVNANPDYPDLIEN